MMSYSFSTLLLSVFTIILITRLLPYIFAKRLKEARMIQCVGKKLPAYIMALLLIYEVQIETFLKAPYGLPELLALGCVLVVHLWRRQLLLSLCLGTGCYALLLKFIF